MPQQNSTAKNRDDENIGEMRRQDAIEMSMQKFTRKIVELEVFERMAHETKVKLRKKKKEVEDENRKLNELQYQKLDRMENFCDKIWKFSSENDLCSVFNKYLTMPKRTSWESLKLNSERDPEILKLREEIEILKKQLIDKKSTRLSFDEQLLEAQIELQIAELYCEKNPEMIRLKKDIEKARENLQALDSKIATIEKEIFEQRQNSSFSPAKDKKFHFVTASEFIAKSNEDDTIKRPKFSVKKESAISRKLSKRGTN